MKAVIFDLMGKIGHFRRPDTTVTHLTYPFITPLAAKGLVGAILGITDFTTTDKIGIQLLKPVNTTSQQLSLLGGGKTFNRPTTVELLVNPAYRIYYAGDEYVDELAKELKNKNSIYPTYLGVAFALTFPNFVGYYDEVDIIDTEKEIRTASVVPVPMIEKLVFKEGYTYNRAGGFIKDYLGNREFEKSVSFIYEKHMRNINFVFNPDSRDIGLLLDIGGEFVCLI